MQYRLPNIGMLLDRQSRPDYKVNPLLTALDKEHSAFLDKIQGVISSFQKNVSIKVISHNRMELTKLSQINYKELENLELPLGVAALAPKADMQKLRVYLDYMMLLVIFEVMRSVISCVNHRMTMSSVLLVMFQMLNQGSLIWIS